MTRTELEALLGVSIDAKWVLVWTPSRCWGRHGDLWYPYAPMEDSE